MTRGFTLIEVLVAMAIVAIGMAAVLGALSSSAKTVSYMRDKTLAGWVGLNQIATLRLSGQQPKTGTTNGDTDYAGSKWHWRQEVTASEVQGVVRIDVSVRPADIKAGDNDGWFATVSGISGDAVGQPQGDTTWGNTLMTNGANGQMPGSNSLGGPSSFDSSSSSSSSSSNSSDPFGNSSGSSFGSSSSSSSSNSSSGLR